MSQSKISIGWIKWDTQNNSLAMKGKVKGLYSRTPKHIIYKSKGVAERNCRPNEIVEECFIERNV